MNIEQVNEALALSDDEIIGLIYHDDGKLQRALISKARAYVRGWETCPTCEGSGQLTLVSPGPRPEDAREVARSCPDCVDGMVPGPQLVERAAQPLADNDGIEVLDWHRDLARAVLLASRREEQ